MGKIPVSILKSTNSNLFAYPTVLSVKKADKQGYRGVIIRITNKDDISDDFECYDGKGERIKSKEKLIMGNIPDGQFSKEKTNAFNNAIHRIHSKVMEYIDNNTYNKDLLWNYVYGDKLYKRKRTKYITIPLHDKGRIIDSLELEHDELNELLNPNLVKDKKTGKTFLKVIDEDGEDLVMGSMSEDGRNDHETAFEFIANEKSSKEEYERYEKKLNEFEALPTAEKYAKGLFNKKDIFEIFAMTYYDDKNEITNDFYPKIVIRLFEYKERARPSSNVKDYNLEWILNFFRWFEEHGYYKINTASFDPLKYDPAIFSKDKERTPYTGKSLQKMINIMKDLSRKFAKRGLLPRIENMEDLKLKSFSKKKNRSGTRKEYALTKDEFDSIYWHKIEDKDLKKYQEIFNEINGTKTLKISTDQLCEAKDMFVCQVMFGGLRGWHDYKTVEIRKHSKDQFKVCFKVGKKDDAIENPLNVYTKAILKERNNKHPFIGSESLYRSLIKTVVWFLKDTFDRDVKPNKYENEYVKLYELFQSGWFARKTFAQILDSVKVDDDDIELFTGHERERSELRTSYLDRNTIEKKSEMIKRLKIGKGLK